MYLSVIKNNKGFSGNKFDSVPVSQNEVKYTHLPEMKVEFYTLSQSRRGKKHILLGNTYLYSPHMGVHLSPGVVLQVSPNGYKQVPGDVLSGMFPEAVGYRMLP